MKFNTLVRLVLILTLCTLTPSVWAQNQPVQATWVAKDFKFHDGSVLPELRLAYTTLGNPKNPVIVVLHGTNGSGTGMLNKDFGGQLFEPGQAFDANQYFIVLPDALGAGRSSKPSDGLRMRFPAYDYDDMVEAQYRLLRDHLGIKLTLEPKFFPTNELPAALCVIALREQGRMAEAIKLAHAVLAAIWAEERNPGDPATLRAILGECGLDADAVLKASEGMAPKREAYTKHAIEQSVFGAPFFVIDGEPFWGQDRLDFVEHKLAG